MDSETLYRLCISSGCKVIPGQSREYYLSSISLSGHSKNKDPHLYNICHCGKKISAVWVQGEKCWSHDDGSGCKLGASPDQKFTIKK